MFIDVGESNKMQFGVVTRTNDDRAFSIKVTQLRDPRTLSPSGCFQYHTNIEGIIKTFNYDDNSQIQLRRVPSYFVSAISRSFSLLIAFFENFSLFTKYVNKYWRSTEDQAKFTSFDPN